MKRFLTKRDANSYGYTDLFRTPGIRRMTMCLAVCWYEKCSCCYDFSYHFHLRVTVTLIYYAISLNPSKIGGNVYSSFITSGLAEIPAVLLLIFTLDFFGRRFLQAAGFTVSGLSLMILLLTDKGATVITKGLRRKCVFFVESFITSALIWLSKWGVTTAFCVIYLLTSECFPTVLRTIAVGFMVTVSRFGGILSPFANMYFVSFSLRFTQFCKSFFL